MTEFSKIARRITWVLFANQSLASAGFIAAATINSILGAQLGGSDYWTGVPSAVYLVGSAIAASLWGISFERIGRRNSMVFGLLLGVIGNTLVLFAIRASSLSVFLAGMLLMGITNAAVVLGRFAAAEVNLPDQRGKAISQVVWGGTFGAVFGPMLVGPMGRLVTGFGMNELAGPYLATLVLFVLAAVVVAAGLRPDPRELGREVATRYPESAPHGETRPLRAILLQPAALTAVVAMILGQVVMVGLMVITSRHMNHHQHGLTDISHVIQSHTIGMYAFSVVSGYLVDKWGRGQVILSGAAMLLLSCILAPLSPDVIPLAVALFFLGLGWNFCFVGGSTLLADQLSPAERSSTQGFSDLLVGFASAAASLSSGFIFAATNYTIISIAAGGLSLIPLVMSLFWLRKQKTVVVAA
jgi:MFS family permease